MSTEAEGDRVELGNLEPSAIISYHQMCTEEHEVRLQRGMNFRLDPRYSVMLMNRREGAPYSDSVENGGETLIYEGHDASRVRGGPDPTSIDQPLAYASGRPTQNGLFHEAALAYREGRAEAEHVKVYEKLLRGTWVFNGLFRLTDCWSEERGRRSVFKFRLDPVPEGGSPAQPTLRERSRMIPSGVKREVWERDRGRCVICGATDELHFDHVIPYSAGGSSVTADNVQILCARHNLEKSDRIE